MPPKPASARLTLRLDRRRLREWSQRLGPARDSRLSSRNPLPTTTYCVRLREAIWFSVIRIVVFCDLLLFFLNESANFIALDILTGRLTIKRHELFAFLRNHQRGHPYRQVLGRSHWHGHHMLHVHPHPRGMQKKPVPEESSSFRRF